MAIAVRPQDAASTAPIPLTHGIRQPGTELNHRHAHFQLDITCHGFEPVKKVPGMQGRPGTAPGRCAV